MSHRNDQHRLCRIGQTPRAAWFALFLAFFLALSCSPVRADHHPWVIAQDHSWPPFAFLDAQGEPQGLLIDLWRTIGERTGRPVEFLLVDWQASLELVRDGQAYVHGGLLYSAERDAFLDFSRELLPLSAALFVAAEAGVNSDLDLAGRVVGVTRGGVEESYARQHYPDVELALFDNNRQLVAAAAAGVLQAFVADYPVGMYFLDRFTTPERFRVLRVLYTLPMYAAVADGDAELLREINAALALVGEDDLARITQKWMRSEQVEVFPSWLLPTAAVLAAMFLFGSLALYSLLLKRQVQQRTRDLERTNATLRKESDFSRSLVDTSPMFFIAIDAELRIMMINDAMAQAVGHAPEDLLGRPVLETFIPAEQRSGVRGAFLRLLSDAGTTRTENCVLTRDGRRLWVEWHGRAVTDSGGRPKSFFGFGLDVTERRATEEKLRQAAIVFETTREAIVIADAGGAIVAVNPAFAEITGFTECEVVGHQPQLLRRSHMDTPPLEVIGAALEQGDQWQGEVWLQRKSGERFPGWLNVAAVRDEHGAVARYIGTFSDIGGAKRSEKELARLAHYDQLTHLPNRLLLQLRLSHALARARQHGHQVAVLFLDLDHFKVVNDSLGHGYGDELLRRVAGLLSGRLRSDDTLARWGGDEFILLLEQVRERTQVGAVAEALLERLAVPHMLSNGREVYVGGSIGISLYPQDGQTVDELIMNADTAMYQAKEHGRNTHHFYTPALTSAANERLAMETSLRRALEREEFVLHYQPQVAVRDGALLGAEALVRWRHPQDGLVAPGRFIPLAEDSGFIVSLGAWVLREACRQAKRWHDAYGAAFVLSVNLSARQLQQPDLARLIEDILADTGLPASALILEITESAIMAQRKQAEATLQALRRMGVGLSIDDFGTGYSSLSYLKRFPIDTLKIDRTFMQDIPRSTSDMEIASTIIAMARSLNLGVVAEGVERPEQLDFLSAQGCDHYQGYLHSEPLEAVAFDRYLERALTAAAGGDLGGLR